MKFDSVGRTMFGAVRPGLAIPEGIAGKKLKILS